MDSFMYAMFYGIIGIAVLCQVVVVVRGLKQNSADEARRKENVEKAAERRRVQKTTKEEEEKERMSEEKTKAEERAKLTKLHQACLLIIEELEDKHHPEERDLSDTLLSYIDRNIDHWKSAAESN